MSATLFGLIKHPMGWILAILSSFLPSTLPAFAEQVTLRLSPGDSIAQGHHVFMRTEGQAYDYARWIYQGAHSTVTIDNLQPGTVYYFVARAYSGNVVSIDSNEVAFMIPDADADGISDAKEIDQYGTDPHNPDSDGDGMTDGQELEFWGGEWSADGDHDGIINLLDTNASYADIRAQDSITQVPVPEATPSPVGKIYQWLEAEDADVYHPMQIENGDAQCSGEYVQIAAGMDNFYGWPGSPFGAIAYDFDIPASGRYVIWGRVLAQSQKGSSFWVSVDDKPLALWDLERSNQWMWHPVSDHPRPGKMVYELSAGSHSLMIQQHQSSPKIDQLFITNAAHFLD